MRTDRNELEDYDEKQFQGSVGVEKAMSQTSGELWVS